VHPARLAEQHDGVDGQITEQAAQTDGHSGSGRSKRITRSPGGKKCSSPPLKFTFQTCWPCWRSVSANRVKNGPIGPCRSRVR
jgi:hypothetical protein